MVQGRQNFLSTFNIVLTASCVESIILILLNWWLFSLTFLRNRNTHLKFFPSPPNVDDSCRRRRRSSTQNRLLMFGCGRHVECRPAAGGSRPLKVTANITELVSPNCYRKPERAAPGIAPLQSPTFPPRTNAYNLLGTGLFSPLREGALWPADRYYHDVQTMRRGTPLYRSMYSRYNFCLCREIM